MTFVFFCETTKIDNYGPYFILEVTQKQVKKKKIGKTKNHLHVHKNFHFHQHSLVVYEGLSEA